MIKTKQLSKMRAIRNSCSICMGSLKDPVLISCHHSFCSKCLDDYVRVNLRNGLFDCPLCRTSVELPKGGVSDFQTNIDDESDFVGNFICDLCGPKSMACRRCLDCNQNLCLLCCNVHEKLNASRDHRVSDLGTLDPEMKGKIKQRVFCDQHPEKELELFCRKCKEIICLLCKAVKHDGHTTDTVTDAADKVKKTLQAKVNSCSEKLRTIAEFIRSGEDLGVKINNAERKDIKALEDQRLQLMKVLDEEFANLKDKIQIAYKNRMQQNEDFIKYMQDELRAYSDANLNARKLIEQGSDIDVIKKAPELEKLISTAVSKSYLTPEPSLESDLFVPANIKPSEIISLIGTMRESTKISTEEQEKPLGASKSSIFVVAIDFGAAYSGWACSSRREFKIDPMKIMVKHWDHGYCKSLKVPTAVLIQPDGITLNSFGYDAENRYAELAAEKEYKQWYYFRRFKMMLHRNLLYEKNFHLEDETKKSLPAKTVVSLLIRYLKDDALQCMNVGLRMEYDITWVLTVPAVWNVSAKQFMREAAVQAGIPNENILIAIEPETASIYCRFIPIKMMADGEMMTFSPGSKYMVLYAGDVTVDITVHEVMTGGKGKEVHKASGGAWDETQVDDAYKEFLISLVGKSVFERFQSEYKEDHLDMLREFKSTSETKNNFYLPRSLLQIFEDETRENLSNAIMQTQYAGKVSCIRDKLRVDASVMNDLFSKAIKNTVSNVKELMKDSRIQGISSILMVGAFSESKMLQHVMKYNFPNVEVIVPTDANIVVLMGAVVFGHTRHQ